MAWCVQHSHMVWLCGTSAAGFTLVISLGNFVWLFLLLQLIFPVWFWIGLSAGAAVLFVSSTAQDFIWGSRSLFLDWSFFIIFSLCSTSLLYDFKSLFRDFFLPHFPPLIKRNRYILFCLLMAVFSLSIYGLYRSRVNTIWCQYSSNIVMQPSYIYDLFPL